MTKIIKKTLQNDLYYKGNIILRYIIEFPQVYDSNKFNSYNYKKAKSLQKKCETELYEDAKKTYDYNIKNGYPIMIYEVLSKFYITYNYNNIVSFYTDEYTFSGGAHGNTIRTSQTWELNAENIIILAEFYKDEPNYVSHILKNINEQIANNIKNGNNYYFDNYCCLTSANFKVENYYLTKENKIAIYYQQYEIAPYSSGILNFYI